MIRRVSVTAFLILLAFGGFAGIADGKSGLFAPFGWAFLGLAAVVWHQWTVIVGKFSPALFDGMCARDCGGFRADDDHYRRDGQRNYRETE